MGGDSGGDLGGLTWGWEEGRLDVESEEYPEGMVNCSQASMVVDKLHMLPTRRKVQREWSIKEEETDVTANNAKLCSKLYYELVRSVPKKDHNHRILSGSDRGEFMDGDRLGMRVEATDDERALLKWSC